MKGRLCIGHIHSNQRDDYIRIEVIDEMSGTVVIDVEAEKADFFDALLGSHGRPCLFQLISTVVGKMCENKDELVPRPPIGKKLTEKDLKKYLQPFEKDGWHGSLDNLQNHHRWVDKNGEKLVRVSFHRFVDAQ